MKYVIGYSGGKDCTFTIEKLKEQGHELVGIFVMKSDAGYSYNHALTEDIYKQYAEALGVELYLINCTSVFDQKAIYETMVKMKNNGVEGVAYGATFAYFAEMKALTNKVGLKLFAPLIDINRDELMNELLSRNYKILIINISKDLPFSKQVIGKVIDKDMIELFKKEGKDFTGNDGCYHSQVIDCSLFKHPIKLGKSRIVELNKTYLVVFD